MSASKTWEAPREVVVVLLDVVENANDDEEEDDGERKAVQVAIACNKPSSRSNRTGIILSNLVVASSFERVRESGRLDRKKE